MKREELSAALKKALKIPGMQTHINRKTAAWRLIHKRDGLKGIYNPTREIIYGWVKGKVASILYSRLHQKSLEELYEMYTCGMTAGEMNFLDEFHIGNPEVMKTALTLAMNKSQATLAEAKKQYKKIAGNYCEVHKKFFSRSCLYCEKELDSDMKNKNGTWKL